MQVGWKGHWVFLSRLLLGLDPRSPLVPQPPELKPSLQLAVKKTHYTSLENHCGPKGVQGSQAMKGSKVCCQAGNILTKRKYPFCQGTAPFLGGWAFWTCLKGWGPFILFLTFGLGWDWTSLLGGLCVCVCVWHYSLAHVWFQPWEPCLTVFSLTYFCSFAHCSMLDIIWSFSRCILQLSLGADRWGRQGFGTRSKWDSKGRERRPITSRLPHQASSLPGRGDVDSAIQPRGWSWN